MAESNGDGRAVLDQRFRHDIRGHLNDIYCNAQTLIELARAGGLPDVVDLAEGQMNSVDIINKMLDLTITQSDRIIPGSVAFPAATRYEKPSGDNFG